MGEREYIWPTIMLSATSKATITRIYEGGCQHSQGQQRDLQKTKTKKNKNQNKHH